MDDEPLARVERGFASFHGAACAGGARVESGRVPRQSASTSPRQDYPPVARRWE